MKLPSLSHLTQQSAKTFSRFPFALIVAMIGTAAALITANRDVHMQENPLNNVMVSASLGISLLMTIVLLGERRKWNSLTKLIAQIAGVLLLIGYYVTLPADIFSAPTAHAIRYAILFVAIHLLTAAAPFIGKNEPQAFWQYNKTLFIRILTALLYSGVLFIGLTIALQALEHLFNIDISGKRYAQLWIVIMGVFNTWFFLSGVPEDLDQLESNTDYPRGLKIFTQYVLLPLVTVYLVILYAYAGKISLEHQWPQGWVSSLILGFSITGILALLLVHPIKDRIENIWIRTVSKWYYIVLVPLDIMLLLAIWRRVSEYGITESRYIVTILGVWLTAMTIYFVVSQTKNIKVIPLSLCVVAFLSSFGPWGAFDYSIANQMHRLEPLLQQYHILEQGTIQLKHDTVPVGDLKQISSIVEYINEVHGVKPLQPWFTTPLDTLGGGENISRYSLNANRSKLIVEMMGLEYIPKWQAIASKFIEYRYRSSDDSVIEIEGFSQLIHLQFLYGPPKKNQPTSVSGISVLTDQDSLSVKIHASGTFEDSLIFDLRQLGARLRTDYPNFKTKENIPIKKMTLWGEGAHLKAKLLVHRLYFQEASKPYTNQFDADLFLAIKQ